VACQFPAATPHGRPSPGHERPGGGEDLLIVAHPPIPVNPSRQLNERAGDLMAALRSAATVEPDMARPYAAGIHRHRQGMRATARRPSELGALRAGVSEHEAAALLDCLLAPESWATLTAAHGLSWEACAELLNRSARRALAEHPCEPLSARAYGRAQLTKWQPGRLPGVAGA
jgi:hypothetical protein